MGVFTVDQTADYSFASMGLDVPVTSGLEYLNFFGVDASAAYTGLNLEIDKPGVSIIGAPVVGQGFITTTNGLNNIISGLQDQAEVTMLIVARDTDFGVSGGGVGYVMGNYSGSTLIGHGSGCYFQSNRLNGLAGYNNSGADAPLQPQAPVPDGTSFNFYAVRFGASIARVDNMTTAQNGTANVLYPRAVTQNFYHIGGANAAPGPVRTVDLAFGAIYSRALSSVEVGLMYGFVQPACAQQGIAC